MPYGVEDSPRIPAEEISPERYIEKVSLRTRGEVIDEPILPEAASREQRTATTTSSTSTRVT